MNIAAEGLEVVLVEEEDLLLSHAAEGAVDGHMAGVGKSEVELVVLFAVLHLPQIVQVLVVLLEYRH